MNEAKKIEMVMESSGLVEAKVRESDAEVLMSEIRIATFALFSVGRNWKDAKGPIEKENFSRSIKIAEKAIADMKKAESKLT